MTDARVQICIMFGKLNMLNSLSLKTLVLMQRQAFNNPSFDYGILNFIGRLGSLRIPESSNSFIGVLLKRQICPGFFI